jgi:hypothetical protein
LTEFNANFSQDTVSHVCVIIMGYATWTYKYVCSVILNIYWLLKFIIMYKPVTMYEKTNTIYNYNYICGNIIFMLHIALYLSIWIYFYSFFMLFLFLFSSCFVHTYSVYTPNGTMVYGEFPSESCMLSLLSYLVSTMHNTQC